MEPEDTSRDNNSIEEKKHRLEIKKHTDLIEVERQKVRHDELRLSNESSELKDRIRKSNNSKFKNPLILAIAGATVAAIGNIYSSHVSALNASALETQKAESALITKMLETAGNIQGARDNLEFLMDAGLIDNEERIIKIKQYLEEKPDDVGPSLTSSSTVTQEYDLADMSIKQLVGLFNSSERLRASNELIVRHTESPELVVDALIESILPENDRKSYRVNIYIALTLSQLKPSWVSTDAQRNEITELQSTENYKDATYSLRVKQALDNFKPE